MRQDSIVYTPSELADVLGLSMPVIYGLLKRKLNPIPSVRVGKKYLIPKTGLMDWMTKESEN